MASDQDLYNELAFYSLAHTDRSFPHQHIVDAYAAQHADEHAKPIRVVFALVGLYLCVEKHFTGNQVQRVHMQLSKRRKHWPALTPPMIPGEITVAEVLAVPAGNERDEMIRKWCVSVWAAWERLRAR